MTSLSLGLRYKVHSSVPTAVGIRPLCLGFPSARKTGSEDVNLDPRRGCGTDAAISGIVAIGVEGIVKLLGA